MGTVSRRGELKGERGLSDLAGPENGRDRVPANQSCEAIGFLWSGNHVIEIIVLVAVISMKPLRSSSSKWEQKTKPLDSVGAKPADLQGHHRRGERVPSHHRGDSGEPLRGCGTGPSHFPAYPWGKAALRRAEARLEVLVCGPTEAHDVTVGQVEVWLRTPARSPKELLLKDRLQQGGDDPS